MLVYVPVEGGTRSSPRGLVSSLEKLFRSRDRHDGRERRMIASKVKLPPTNGLLLLPTSYLEIPSSTCLNYSYSFGFDEHYLPDHPTLRSEIISRKMETNTLKENGSCSLHRHILRPELLLLPSPSFSWFDSVEREELARAGFHGRCRWYRSSR